MTSAEVPELPWSLEDGDSHAEHVVLQHLLAVHPDVVTVQELIREIEGEAVDFETRDAIRRAARDLSGVGLVHFRGDLVWPTRAALRYEQIRIDSP
jgi:creatinine amidohydrolase/Fe(II)-dependent formamide hydrolase-like protein